MDRSAKRILIISEHFPPANTGGTATYTYHLTSGLAELGWNVYLITQPAVNEPCGKWYTKQGIQIYRLEIPLFSVKILAIERAFGLYLLKQLSPLVRKIQPDLIHFCGGWYPLFASRFCRTLKNCPVIWTLHNVPPAEHHLNLFSNRRANRLFETPYLAVVAFLAKISLRLFRYDFVIGSNKLNAAKIAGAGVLSNKIRVVPYGVEMAHFSANRPRMNRPVTAPLILCVAGIIEHKGQLNIVKAAPEIIARFPGTTFVLVGPVRSPQYLKLLKETIGKMKLEAAFTITGEIPYEDLVRYFNECDLYIQPSLEEGFSIAFLEAMASGKPVIGTPVGEIPNLINESGAGVLLSSSDPQQIASAAISLLGNAELRNSLGHKSREYIMSNYSWGMVAQRTSEIYQEAMLKKAIG